MRSLPPIKEKRCMLARKPELKTVHMRGIITKDRAVASNRFKRPLVLLQEKRGEAIRRLRRTTRLRRISEDGVEDFSVGVFDSTRRDLIELKAG